MGAGNRTLGITDKEEMAQNLGTGEERSRWVERKQKLGNRSLGNFDILKFKPGSRGSYLQSQHLGGSDRKITLNSKPGCQLWWSVSSQPGL